MFNILNVGPLLLSLKAARRKIERLESQSEYLEDQTDYI